MTEAIRQTAAEQAGDDWTEVEGLRQQLAETQHELDAYQAGLGRQLDLAARIHRSLLPQPVRTERIHVDVRYIPIEPVGGDYCQVRFADPQTCYITMCDVTGHGIGASLLATRVSSEVRHGILYGRPPREIVRTLNAFIYQHFEESGLYLTFVAAQIDLPRRLLTYCGAGHPSPLLVRRDGSAVEELPSQNPMIGVMTDVLDDEPEHTLALAPGDRLLFYTDGLTETADAAGRQFGTEGLAEIASQAMAVELFDMADFILDRLDTYQHGPATDDKTLIVAEIR